MIPLIIFTVLLFIFTIACVGCGIKECKEHQKTKAKAEEDKTYWKDLYYETFDELREDKKYERRVDRLYYWLKECEDEEIKKEVLDAVMGSF